MVSNKFINLALCLHTDQNHILMFIYKKIPNNAAMSLSTTVLIIKELDHNNDTVQLQGCTKCFFAWERPQ